MRGVYISYMKKTTKSKYQAQMKWRKAKYWRRKKEALELLGGKCVWCGSKKMLDFDHIDPKTMRFRFADMADRKHETFLEELKKCQILCRPCHAQKTHLDRGHKIAKGTHGTESAYNWCHCKECRKAHTEAQKKRDERRAFRFIWVNLTLNHSRLKK